MYHFFYWNIDLKMKMYTCPIAISDKNSIDFSIEILTFILQLRVRCNICEKNVRRHDNLNWIYNLEICPLKILTIQTIRHNDTCFNLLHSGHNIITAVCNIAVSTVPEVHNKNRRNRNRCPDGHGKVTQGRGTTQSMTLYPPFFPLVTFTPKLSNFLKTWGSWVMTTIK